MPNWVMNKIELSGNMEQVNALLDKVMTSENSFDFNGLVPMPKSMNLTSGGYQNEFVSCYLLSLSPKKRDEVMNALHAVPCYFYGNYYRKFVSYANPIDGIRERLVKAANEEIPGATPEEVGKAYVDNVIQYGTDDWYDWSCKYWGTKWNSCDTVIDTLHDDAVYVEFQTAWSSPFPIFDAIKEQYPEINVYVQYADEDIGNNCGIWHNGTVNYVDDAEFACHVWDMDYADYTLEV